MIFAYRKAESPPDLMKISRAVDPLINQATLDIFMAHKGRLLQEQIEYIVPAVWGVKKGGETDATQKQIFTSICSVEAEIKKTFGVHNLSPEQEFALVYLIKGVFIARITYMIELVKNLSARGEDAPDISKPFSVH